VLDVHKRYGAGVNCLLVNRIEHSNAMGVDFGRTFRRVGAMAGRANGLLPPRGLQQAAGRRNDIKIVRDSLSINSKRSRERTPQGALVCVCVCERCGLRTMAARRMRSVADISARIFGNVVKPPGVSKQRG